MALRRCSLFDLSVMTISEKPEFPSGFASYCQPSTAGGGSPPVGFTRPNWCNVEHELHMTDLKRSTSVATGRGSSCPRDGLIA